MVNCLGSFFMKKILLTLALLIVFFVFVASVKAQTITTGNSNSSSTVINCINNTHINSAGNGCIPNNPGNPTPAPTNNPGNPGGGGGGGGTSGGSSPINCTLGVPGDTTLLSVVKNSANSVVLTWTAASGANDYTIEYGLSSNNYQYGVPNTGNVTSYTIGALDLSKTYYFKVIPLDGCRQGNPSNEVSTAFGGPIGLSNTSSDNNSIIFLIGAIALISSGIVLLIKNA